MPTITVVVPVYKVEMYLKRCIDSILNQSFKDYDLILIDDGSPDASGCICDQYAAQYSFIHVIHQQNGGLSAARNTGIGWAFEYSNSQWLTFIDSDDWIHSNYLEVLLSAARLTNTNISCCSFYKTAKIEDVDLFSSKIEPCTLKTEEFWCSNNLTAIIAWAKLYKKDLFSEIRYPIGKLHEDEFTTFRILFKETVISYIDLPYYFYFQREQSIMHGVWNEKHIAEVEAKQLQVNYFLQNGYHKAAATSAKSYVSSIYRNLQSSLRMGNQCSGSSKMLKHKLGKSLIKYGRLADITLKNSSWLYYAAFPKLLLPYRVIRKVLKKFA